jgi:hypothetical protein
MGRGRGRRGHAQIRHRCDSGGAGGYHSRHVYRVRVCHTHQHGIFFGEVLDLISHQTSLQVIDIGATGNSPGDQVIETTVDFADGKQVDRSVLNCVDITVTTSGFDVLCHGALIFTDGQVEFQGETNFETPFTVAVTGGTGVYQNVGGQFTVERTLPDTTTDVETLRLVFFN